MRAADSPTITIPPLVKPVGKNLLQKGSAMIRYQRQRQRWRCLRPRLPPLSSNNSCQQQVQQVRPFRLHPSSRAAWWKSHPLHLITREETNHARFRVRPGLRSLLLLPLLIRWPEQRPGRDSICLCHPRGPPPPRSTFQAALHVLPDHRRREQARLLLVVPAVEEDSVYLPRRSNRPHHLRRRRRKITSPPPSLLLVLVRRRRRWGPCRQKRRTIHQPLTTSITSRIPGQEVRPWSFRDPRRRRRLVLHRAPKHLPPQHPRRPRHPCPSQLRPCRREGQQSCRR